MAIRALATRGFGNGVFNGTIPLAVTRGYSIGEALSLVYYPIGLVAGQVYHGGLQRGQKANTGLVAGQAYHGGLQRGQRAE